jgi:hypothetical protein
MKKLLIVGLSAVLALMAIEPAHAQKVPTIAIIDTAVDSSKVKNVIHEVCFTQENTCLNKTNSQEGKGSAGVLKWTLGLDHGNQVAQAAATVNPNIKIVFIRIADERLTSNHSYGTSRQKAMDWIVLNADKFGINAVSISTSLGRQTPSTCLTYEGYSAMRSSTKSLFEKNIPVFAATGNDGDKTRIGFPACIDNVIAVGATRLNGTAWASYSNIGTGLNGTGINAVARGDASVNVFNKPGLNTVTGTSIATPIAASFTATNILGKTFDNFVATLPNKISYPQFGN